MYYIKQRNGNKVIRHKIYVKEPNSKSYASYLLLKDSYNYYEFETSYVGTRIEFSRKILSDWKNKLGTLTCIYCETKNLEIQYDKFTIDSRKKATLDHIIPIGNGGDIFDVNNVICACEKCNNNKKDLPLDIFLINYNINSEDFNKRLLNFRQQTK